MTMRPYTTTRVRLPPVAVAGSPLATRSPLPLGESLPEGVATALAVAGCEGLLLKQ